MTSSKGKSNKIDWNIWHDAFMNAYEQIDFVTCAKAILYYNSLRCETSEIKDPNSNEEVDMMVCELKDSVDSATKRAIEVLMSPDYKIEPYCYISSGNVRVTAWKPVEGQGRCRVDQPVLRRDHH